MLIDKVGSIFCKEISKRIKESRKKLDKKNNGVRIKKSKNV